MSSKTEFSSEIDNVFSDEKTRLKQVVSDQESSSTHASNESGHSNGEKENLQTLLSFYLGNKASLVEARDAVNESSGIAACITELTSTTNEDVEAIKSNAKALVKALKETLASYEDAVIELSKLESKISTRLGHSDHLAKSLAKDEQTFETLGKQLGGHVFSSTELAMDSVSIGATFDFTTVSEFLATISTEIEVFYTSLSETENETSVALFNENQKSEKLRIDMYVEEAVTKEVSEYANAGIAHYETLHTQRNEKPSEKKKSSK